MAFKKLDLSGKVKTGCFKIQTMQIKDGPWKVQISMTNSEFTRRFGEATNFDFYIGEGVDAGKLALKPETGGQVKAMFFKSAVLFRLPAFDGVPQAKFISDEPDRRDSEGMLVLVLPTWWNNWKSIIEARKAAQKHSAVEAGRLAR